MLSSYSRYLDKIQEKHRMGVVPSIAYELIIRAYIRPQIRGGITTFYPSREPQKHWSFLLGCYNSGTTILRSILGFHPEISTLPREGERFTNVFPDLNSNGWIRMILRNLDMIDMDLNQAKCLSEKAIKDWSPWWGNTPVFLEKSITHSVRIPFLENAFDHPKFIALVRNGYCVSEGIRRRASPKGSAKQEIGDQYPMDMLAQQWKFINQRIRQDSTSVKNILFVSYEDFIDSPVSFLTEIFEFLEVSPIALEFDNDILKVGEQLISIKKTNKSSIERLSLDDILLFNKCAEDELLHYGYEVLGH